MRLFERLKARADSDGSADDESMALRSIEQGNRFEDAGRLRPLAVAKALGPRTVLGSICAKNTRDEEQADYGYRPLFGALGRRIAETLVKP